VGASATRRPKNWLTQAAIDPHDQGLQDDLEGSGFHLNLKNQLVIESKDEMQERGIASPDDADALALTWAQPVAPPAASETPMADPQPSLERVERGVQKR